MCITKMELEEKIQEIRKYKVMAVRKSGEID